MQEWDFLRKNARTNSQGYNYYMKHKNNRFITPEENNYKDMLATLIAIEILISKNYKILNGGPIHKAITGLINRATKKGE